MDYGMLVNVVDGGHETFFQLLLIFVNSAANQAEDYTAAASE